MKWNIYFVIGSLKLQGKKTFKNNIQTEMKASWVKGDSMALYTLFEEVLGKNLLLHELWPKIVDVFKVSSRQKMKSP